MTEFRNLNLDTSLGGNSPSDYAAPSQKAIKTYVDSELTEKQDVLESGVNIKTINNQSILGSGNVNIGGSVTFTYDAATETLTIS